MLDPALEASPKMQEKNRATQEVEMQEPYPSIRDGSPIRYSGNDRTLPVAQGDASKPQLAGIHAEAVQSGL